MPFTPPAPALERPARPTAASRLPRWARSWLATPTPPPADPDLGYESALPWALDPPADPAAPAGPATESGRS